jgi:hypothetical protein
MTAEDRLKEIREGLPDVDYTHKDIEGRIYIASADIDLIADLVVERLTRTHNNARDGRIVK